MQTIRNKHGSTTPHTKDNTKERNEVFLRPSGLKKMIQSSDRNSNLIPAIYDHINFEISADGGIRHWLIGLAVPLLS